VVESMPVSYLLKRTAGWTLIKREKGDEIYVTFARTPGAAAGSTARDLQSGPPEKK